MNTIRELKQQEKYKNMLKRKNKEKNIYKTQNSTLRIKYEGIKKLLEKKDKEIERLNKYKNFIKSIIITLEPWSKNEKGYELHNISKQELYKELYELRQEILKGEDK